MCGNILDFLKTPKVSLIKAILCAKSVAPNSNISATRLTWRNILRGSTSTLPITNTPGYIQRTLDQVAKLPPNSEKAKRITRSVAGFIAKDLRPYSVVENQGFRTMLQVLEPRYTLPSRRYFSETAVPALYSECKDHILESLILPVIQIENCLFLMIVHCNCMAYHSFRVC